MRKPFNRYNTLRAQNFETSWRCYLATIANHYVCCESTVGYPSDNLAFVLFLRYCSDCSSSATLEKRLLTEAMYRPTSVVTCFFVLQEHDVFGSVRRSVLQCSVRRPVFEKLQFEFCLDKK